jgi:glycosyltransferase involved in cell wall biosynthesis
MVLTVKNPDRHYCDLGNRVPSDNGVYRSSSLFNISLLAGKANGLLARVARLLRGELRHRVVPNLILIPDFASGWIPLTVLKGLQLMKEQDIDVIFATCKPNSAAVIGAVLAQISKVPLVLDFRDPWRKIVFQLAGNRSEALSYSIPDWRDAIDRPLETAVLKRARRVIFTAEGTRILYERLYPFLESKSHTIYNGYADGFFDTPSLPYFEDFTIVYSGNYYFDLDDSEVFFQALRLVKDDPELGGKVHFLYIGESEDVSKMLNRFGLHDVAFCVGPLERAQAIAAMRRSSILLIRNMSPCLSTKLFEGLAAGLPMLALTKEGEAEDLIRRYAPSHFIVSDGGVGSVVEAIRQAFRLWKRNRLKSGSNETYLRLFSKKSLTAKLATILDDAISA